MVNDSKAMKPCSKAMYENAALLATEYAKIKGRGTQEK